MNECLKMINNNINCKEQCIDGGRVKKKYGKNENRAISADEWDTAAVFVDIAMHLAFSSL